VVGSSENVAERVGYRAMPAGIGRFRWAKGDQYWWEAFDTERRRPVCSPRGTRTGINGCYWHDLDCDLNLDNTVERDTKARRRWRYRQHREFPCRKIRRSI